MITSNLCSGILHRSFIYRSFSFIILHGSFIKALILAAVTAKSRCLNCRPAINNGQYRTVLPWRYSSTRLMVFEYSLYGTRVVTVSCAPRRRKELRAKTVASHPVKVNFPATNGCFRLFFEAQMKEKTAFMKDI